MRSNIACIVLLLNACAPKKGSDDGGASATSDSHSGTASSDASNTSTPTSSAATGNESDDGATEGAQLCLEFCARFTMCDLDGAFEGCPCDNPTGQKCVAAWSQALQCFIVESCAELSGGTSRCWGDYEMAVVQCGLGEDNCDFFVQVGGPPDGSCTFGEECLGQPEKLVHCDDTECTCTTNGQVKGICPADGVCGDDNLIPTKVAECCS